MTERRFLKSLTAEIHSRAAGHNAEKIVAEGVPSRWTDSQEKEMTFQVEKQHKRKVEAHMSGHLLAEEQTPQLDQEAFDEAKRQASSYRERAGKRAKYAHQTHATPPTVEELKHCHCYLAEDVASSNVCDHVWHYKLSSLGGMVVNKLWDANLFVERDARVPKNTIVTLAACLVGAWIITPPVLLGLPGPCIKFKKALGTQRIIWASPDFMAMHPLEWQLILELMNSVINKWTLLPSADAWALKKAQYEKKGKPAEVLALVSAHECAANANVKHCFELDDFIKFIASLDVTKGSIGSSSM